MESRPAPKYSISHPPGELERRVFIGGNYDNMALLRHIAAIVERLGFQPLLAFDFNVPEERTREFDLRILHCCKYAIFEITFGDGHVIEADRCFEYDVKALLLYQARDEKNTMPPLATQMLLSSALPRLGYMTFDELEGIIRSFLGVEVPSVGLPTGLEHAVEIPRSIDLITGEMPQQMPWGWKPVTVTPLYYGLCPNCFSPLPQPDLKECPHCHAKLYPKP